MSIQINATTVARDATALNLHLGMGGKYSRLESLSRLTGEGAHSDMLAVSVGDDAQEFDARTLQDHASPHTKSDLLFKNALNGRARNTFGGLIRVEPHAHFTDAYQKVRNLLLSDDAEANSMPGLEIMADNVKCSHGATSGQIDEEEMFYLLRPRHSRAGRAAVAGRRVSQRSPRAASRSGPGGKTRSVDRGKVRAPAALIVCIAFERLVFSLAWTSAARSKRSCTRRAARSGRLLPMRRSTMRLNSWPRKMSARLLVMENEQLVGIVSERDYSRKVMLRGKTSRDQHGARDHDAPS